MDTEMDYYEMLDKGGTHPHEMRPLLVLVDKLAERREISRKEYCNLAIDNCRYAPVDYNGFRDAIIEFLADDVIGMVSRAAKRNGLSVDVNMYTGRLKEFLESRTRED